MTREERERADRLRAYVEAAHDRPATFDECSLWPAQWVVNERGVAFDWPVYSSHPDMVAMIEREGGLVAVWDRVAAAAGLAVIPETDPIPLGSIAVVQTTYNGHIGCILADGHIGCFRALDKDDPSKSGVRMFGLRRHTILKAWAV